MQESNSLQSFGRLMTSLEGTSLTIEDKKLLSNKHVGGIILFSKNFESQLQIQSLCSEIKAVKENIIIAVDQEGGRVQRFKNEFTVLPSMQDLGDIILRAPKGKIRIEAQDIELVANGYNGRTGYIALDSNEKIILKSKSIDIRATETAKFFSENKLDVIGNAIMNIYGGLVDMADGATSIKGSKTGPSSTEENAKKLKE